jgi:hypothetical protein
MKCRAILLLILCTTFVTSGAQSVNGSWYGRADVMVSGATSNYLTEFILKQKGDEVEGLFGYYFKDVYQSFFVRGTYNKASRQLSIKNLPMLFYASTSRSGIECPMHFQGTLMVSRVNSSLTGRFYTDQKYQYTCPEMTTNMTRDAAENSDSTLRATTASKILWKPTEDDIVVNAMGDSHVDSIARFAMLDPLADSGNQQQDPDSKLIEEFGKRKNIYEKDIVVYDDSILVSFYDNGDIDDDTITVFLNKKPILVRRGLTARALNIYIGLDSSRSLNELSMFADNLGKFPPNTALMVISDRQTRYEFYLSASLKQNASVRLKRPSNK